MAPRIYSPGATNSGLSRLLLSTVTGPRLLKGAMLLYESVAPTLTEAAKIAGIVFTVLEADP